MDEETAKRVKKMEEYAKIPLSPITSTVATGNAFVLEFNDHYSFDGFKKKLRLRVTGAPYKKEGTWVVPVEMVDIFNETKKGQVTNTL